MSGLIGCGILSVSIDKWAVWIAISAAKSFGKGKLVGKNLSVSEILSAELLIKYVLWHL